MALGYIYNEPRSRPLSSSTLTVVPNATLTFYLSGTTTLTPIYATANLAGSTLANPITANGSGLFPIIYLDPSIAYRAVLKDGTGTTLEDNDPLPNIQIDPTFAVTPAEQATGVTVTDFTKQPGDLRRYGAVGNGTTSADSAFSAALLQAAYVGASRGASIKILEGTYKLSTVGTYTIPSNVTLVSDGSGQFTLGAGVIIGSSGMMVNPGTVAPLFLGTGVVAGTTYPNLQSYANGISLFGGAVSTPTYQIAFQPTTGVFDCTRSNVFKTTLTANVTVAYTFTSPSDGQTINWFLTQDATGNRTMVWPSNFKWPGGGAGTLSTAPNALDLLVATYFSATNIWVATVTGFA